MHLTTVLQSARWGVRSAGGAVSRATLCELQKASALEQLQEGRSDHGVAWAERPLRKAKAERVKALK